MYDIIKNKLLKKELSSFTSILCSIVFIMFHFPSHSSVLMHGDLVENGPHVCGTHTFSFSIGQFIHRESSLLGYIGNPFSLFVATKEPIIDDTSAHFGIAAVKPRVPTFEALITTGTCLIDGIQGPQNPLAGTGIAQMALLGANPVVVPQGNRGKLILCDEGSPKRILTAELSDSRGNPAESIALATVERTLSNTSAADIVLLSLGMSIINVLRPASGVFGDPGSCISFTILASAQAPSAQTPENTADKEKTAQKSKDTDSKKEKDPIDPSKWFLACMSPFRVDREEKILSIGNPLAHISDWANLRYEEKIHKVFFGCETTSGAEPNDGSYGLLVIDPTINPATRTFPALTQPIAGNLVGSDSIIAARGSGAQVSIYVTRGMYTSTGLTYLIVNGGSSLIPHAHSKRQQIFALPIIPNSGLVASTSAPPTTAYNTVPPCYPIKRFFLTPPQSPEDLYTSKSIPALVGNGPLPGDATDIFVVSDAVFVSTANSYDNRMPGLWHSQALFDAQGKIVSWTPWQRAGGASAAIPIYNIAFDSRMGNWWFSTGESPDSVHTIKMTAWDSRGGLAGRITHEMESLNQKSKLIGITDVQSSPYSGNLTIATGFDTVCITSNEVIENGICKPRTDFSQGIDCTDGSFSTLVTQSDISWITTSGGSLTHLGGISAAAFVHDGTYGWFVVGGSNGIAVLMREDGTGIHLHSGSHNILHNLTPDMYWQQLECTIDQNKLHNIRKLVFDQKALYILSDNTLCAIHPSTQIFKRKIIQNPPVLASTTKLGLLPQASFADCFILENLIFLATSGGLFYTKDNLPWKLFELPYSAGPVVHIVPIGPVHHPQAGYDLNLYVLSAAVTTFQAQIYRITVSCTDRTATNVSLFPDNVLPNRQGYFLSFGNYRNGIATDGALLGSSRSGYLKQQAYHEILAPEWSRWPIVYNATARILQSSLHVPTPKTTSRIRAMIKNSSSGAWLVPGDMGLISNE